jgi:hypothetical protein
VPGAAQDTELTTASPAWLRAPVPRTSWAVPQVPPAWLTTRASVAGVLLVYSPPAVQLPAAAHDTEVIVA